MANRFKIYLSSTLNDFQEERKAVKQKLQPHCDILESYEASEASLRDKCIEDVRSADLYLLLVGQRYGYRPKTKVDNPLGLSITELEYQATFDAGVPRLVYLRKSNADEFVDALTKEAPPELIKNFRNRVSEGNNQVPAQFKTVDELCDQVFLAVIERKARHDYEAALMGSGYGVTNAAQLSTDLRVVCAAGTDSTARDAINRAGGIRIRAVEISPDDGEYLRKLDREVRSTRAAGFLVTTESLNRYVHPDREGLFRKALLTVSRRCGKAFLLLNAVDAAALPESWRQQADCVVIPDAGVNLLADDSAWLGQAFQRVKATTPAIADDRRIGVPSMVVALVASEVEALVADMPHAFDAFVDPEERDLRAKQFKFLVDAIRHLHPAWPDGFYGETPEDWRPFGPAKPPFATGSPTARELLLTAFDRINRDQTPGSRQRRLLLDYQLHPQPYDFDDYVHDEWGSRAMTEEARERGCLVLLDEMALLKPGLREQLDSFLSSQRIAIVSANPCDPAHKPISELLGSLSHLRVGSLFERFREQQDPRCELSLNSAARLQRWLGFVLPDLTTTLGQKEVDPKLAQKSAELFK